jgi:predicted metal-dependent hydrolase
LKKKDRLFFLFSRRWGSCSKTGNIQYNWRVIIAPHHIVDYVVVHELCHLVYHNHSDKFWRSVERALPEYRQDKEWLRLNEPTLSI